MHIASLSFLVTTLIITLPICSASQPAILDDASLLPPGFHPVACASPQSSSLCGRAYYPNFLSAANASLLLSLATAAFSLSPGGSGPVTIVDMVSGALSYRDKFVNLFALLQQKQTFLPLAGLELYLSLTSELSQRLSVGLQSTERLYLTRPSFFSRISAADAANVHDEYWHRHIDREQYGTFEATALVYLSDWADDFDGGEFVFVDKAATHTDDTRRREVEAALAAETEMDAATVQSSPAASGGGGVEEGREWVIRPSLGALAFFSSGEDNVHYVRRVTSGTRYALTIAFTRNEEDSVEPALDKLYGQRMAEWHASRTTNADGVVEGEQNVA